MAERSQLKLGLVYGLLAYTLWGAFPFYFGLLEAVHPFELIPWRVVSCAVSCAIAVTLLRGWKPIVAVFRQPKIFGMFALSGLLVYINWQVFVYGVLSGRVIETALGYFLNPLLSIFFGVVIWKERLRFWQWAAVAIAALGVAASAIAYGQFPFIALGVGLSFSLYGAVRKAAGVHVSALAGLTIETIAVLPLAIPQFVIVTALLGGSTATRLDPLHLTLLLLSGLATAIPLIFFGASAKRLPLSYMGFIQFLTPILSFLYGWLIEQEPMPPIRWFGFAVVWIAIALLLADMVATVLRNRRNTPRWHDVDFPVTGEIGVITQPQTGADK